MKLADAITDTGLRMAALDALLEREQIEPSQLAAAANSGIEAIRANDELWLEEEGERRLNVDECRDQILAELITALGRLELEPDALAGVESLDFDGGNEIYMWIEGTGAELLGLEDWELDTGGESELYTVASFEGIGALKGLVSLSLDAYGYASHARDASPLLALPGLTTLELAGAELSDASVLTKLPALERLRGTRQIDAAVLDELRAAGVDLG